MPSMIDQKDFEKIDDQDVKLNVIFDYIRDIYGICEQRSRNCGDRFKKLENRKKFDMTLSGMFGLVGGFISGLAKTIFKP
jgi:hypothetical protein